MATYRYLFADLLTNQILAELDVTSVNFSQALNSAGTLSASILLSGQDPASNATNATIPARCVVYVDRNGIIVWGGIIWNRSYNSVNQHITITAREFESYFERRRISDTVSYYNTDQLTVAQALLNTAQAQQYGNIGVKVGTELSGVLIARTYYNYEQKSVLSAIQDLSKTGNGLAGSTGFDFAIDCAYDGYGGISKTLNFGYPRIGTPYSATNPAAPVFLFPAGNMVEYEYPEDGSLVANRINATGAGSNEGKLIYNATDTSKLTSGWPLLEDMVAYNDVIDSTLVQALATGQVSAVSYPPVTMKVVANPSEDPVFGSYRIGDDARIQIVDDRFPNGLDATYRITALNVTPGEAGPERVTLTLTLPLVTTTS